MSKMRKKKEVVGLVAKATCAKQFTMGDITNFHKGFGGALRIYRAPQGELVICAQSPRSHVRLKAFEGFMSAFEWRRILVNTRWEIRLD